MFKESDRKVMDAHTDYLRVLNRSMLDLAKSRIKEREELEKAYWRAADAERENAVLKTKVELYEKFIAKMLESDPNKSNDVFMLDGEIYRLSNYTIDAEAGEPKILTAEFKCTSDITRIFKEADDT